MYGLLVIPDHNLLLTRRGIGPHGEDVEVLVCRFEDFELCDRKEEIWVLAREMRDVLNRDLENRSLDIANNPPGFTEQGPELPNASNDCGNPDCEVCSDAVHRDMEKVDMPANEWPIDPESGTPKVEMVGEVKDFPEPGVAHPVGCLCEECDPPIKDAFGLDVIEKTEDAT